MNSPLNFGLAVALMVATPPANAQMITVNVNRVCAAIVGIPYASDNFTDEEWDKFQWCRDYLQQFNGVQ